MIEIHPTILTDRSVISLATDYAVEIELNDRQNQQIGLMATYNRLLAEGTRRGIEEQIPIPEDHSPLDNSKKL